MSEQDLDFSEVWKTMRETLKRHGVDVDVQFSSSGDRRSRRVKAVVVSPGLQSSVEEMQQTTRDQVVMVRVDEATSQALDDWVTTGAVRSRSEAAALFIREGLQVRADELNQLREALHEVEAAKARLQAKAREVFGERSAD